MNIILGEDTERRIVNAFLSNKVKGTYHLAQYLIKKYDIKKSSAINEGNIFDIIEIKVDIQRILKEHTTSRATSETIFKIKHMII